GVIVQPAVGMWQLTQRRPFAPRFWKNSLPRSIEPDTWRAALKPVELRNGMSLGSRTWWLSSDMSIPTGSLSSSVTHAPTRSAVNDTTETIALFIGESLVHAESQCSDVK